MPAETRNTSTSGPAGYVGRVEELDQSRVLVAMDRKEILRGRSRGTTFGGARSHSLF